MGQQWGDEPAWPAGQDPFAGLRWHWRRWRARHYLWLAFLDWLADPATEPSLERAVDFYRRTDTARP
jgi:hypothetical protein